MASRLDTIYGIGISPFAVGEHRPRDETLLDRLRLSRAAARFGDLERDLEGVRDLERVRRDLSRSRGDLDLDWLRERWRRSRERDLDRRRLVETEKEAGHISI